MTTDLLLAPVGAGKTEQALAQIITTAARKPFARIWVLLATERQIFEFRNRLIGEAGTVLFNVEFFTFYELYTRVLEASGTPTREIGEAARLRLLRLLAKRMAARGSLTVYGRIADKAGFARMTADFIYELKQGIIEPHQFARVTAELFGERDKDTELAQLYHVYQERLRTHGVADREGKGWMALSRLAADKQLHRDVDLVVVDGYDQFTPLQAQIVALLSERVGRTLITLTTVPGRENTVGRRFAQAQQALQQAYAKHDLPLSAKSLTEQVEQRHPDLQHLADNIFQPNGDTKPLAGGVRFRAAPDALTETAIVLREVKRLLLMDDNRPEDVLIVLRDYDRYRDHIQNIGRAYGLPLAFHLGTPLAETPPVRALMDLIVLHDPRQNLTGFPYRPLLDALRSPYFQVDGIDDEATLQLDRICRAFSVVGGLQNWLDAIRSAAKPRLVGMDDEREQAALIDEPTRDRLAGALAWFCEAITPPLRATMTEYVRWLEGLIGQDPHNDPDDDPNNGDSGTLNMIASIRGAGVPHIVARDLAAMDEFKQVLRTMLGSQLLLSTLENTDETITWEGFLADLRVSVERAAVESQPTRDGRVLVTTATDARGLPHKHVFVFGLSEGVFPLRLQEDPLYLDSERQQFTDKGLPLRTTAERAADEGLFYELISLARNTLTLSRPTVQDGAPWIESHLWRAAAQVFTDADDLIAAGEMRIGEQVPVQDAATHDEVAMAVAADLTNPQPFPATPGAYNWLLTHAPAVWGAVRIGRTVEAKRFSAAPHDQYTGLITDADLQAQLRKLFKADYRWSASKLNDYGICPFRFFAGRVLRLDELETPEVGIDARQLGSLNHTILERAYRELAEQQVEITPENTGAALAVLNEVADEVLAAAPARLGFRESPMWAQEKRVLRRQLQALVRHDFNEMTKRLAKKGFGSRPRAPYQTEADFGISGKGFLMALGDETVFIGGYIDRIDRYGDDVIVLDYKTGTGTIPRAELQAGRNFQIMLYIQAAQGILDAKRGNEPDVPEGVAGGFFYHIRKPTTSGELVPADEEHQTLITQARHMIGVFIRRARAGDFTVRPSKPAGGRCVAYCPFYRLCRLTVTDAHKPEPRL